MLPSQMCQSLVVEIITLAFSKAGDKIYHLLIFYEVMENGSDPSSNLGWGVLLFFPEFIKN